MGKIDITKFKILMKRWKDPTYLEDINKLSILADETINLVNNEPLLKDICEMFMYAVSVKMTNDQNISVNSPISGNIRKIAK
jgi:hypothetical protein